MNTYIDFLLIKGCIKSVILLFSPVFVGGNGEDSLQLPIT